MSGEAQEIVLFTGQSGLNIMTCLSKLKRPGFEPRALSVEGEMQKASNESFLGMLADPPRVQESRWAQTFEEIMKKIGTGEVGGPCAFLTFHAAYYHQRKCEFSYPVDITKLLRLKENVRMVIVLIDDCYDIYKRLMAEGEMFANMQRVSKEKPQMALVGSITNLLTILEWREVEVAFSRKIAQLLEVPMYIVAVKHPASVVLRLIESAESTNMFYLSHPISSVRGGTYPRGPGFYDELNGFIKNMVGRDDIVLFLPDAIDEKGRIREEEGRYVPELLPGWPLPLPEDWLFTALPAEVERINPLNPGDFIMANAGGGFQEAVSLLLEVLLKKISEQINSRDLSLVEQSKDGIVVYRPFWGASTPGGVEEELKYNADLVKIYGEKDRRVILIDAEEDLAKWRITSLFNYVENIVASLEDSQVQTLKNLCGDWLKNPVKIHEFKSVATINKNRDIIRKEIEGVLPDDYLFDAVEVAPISATLRPAAMLAEEETKARGWEIVIEKLAKSDPFREKYFVSEGDRYIIEPAKGLKEKLVELIAKDFEDKEAVEVKGVRK